MVLHHTPALLFTLIYSISKLCCVLLLAIYQFLLFGVKKQKLSPSMIKKSILTYNLQHINNDSDSGASAMQDLVFCYYGNYYIVRVH